MLVIEKHKEHHKHIIESANNELQQKILREKEYRANQAKREEEDLQQKRAKLKVLVENRKILTQRKHTETEELYKYWKEQHPIIPQNIYSFMERDKEFRSARDNEYKQKVVKIVKDKFKKTDIDEFQKRYDSVLKNRSQREDTIPNGSGSYLIFNNLYRVSLVDEVPKELIEEQKKKNQYLQDRKQRIKRDKIRKKIGEKYYNQFLEKHNRASVSDRNTITPRTKHRTNLALKIAENQKKKFKFLEECKALSIKSKNPRLYRKHQSLAKLESPSPINKSMKKSFIPRSKVSRSQQLELSKVFKNGANAESIEVAKHKILALELRAGMIANSTNRQKKEESDRMMIEVLKKKFEVIEQIQSDTSEKKD